jgi:hypothetical protein
MSLCNSDITGECDTNENMTRSSWKRLLWWPHGRWGKAPEVGIQTPPSFDLTSDDPDEAREFASDGHVDSFLRQSTRAQAPVAFVESQLCALGNVAYEFALIVLTDPEGAGHAYAESISSHRFDRHPRWELISSLGTRSLVAIRRVRELGGISHRKDMSSRA